MFGAMSCYENFMVASTYDASSKVKILAPFTWLLLVISCALLKNVKKCIFYLYLMLQWCVARDFWAKYCSCYE